MAKTNPRALKRLRRKLHIRKRVKGTTARPRLTVFRSALHIYAQVINDETGVTIVAASTLEPALRGEGVAGGNIQAAKRIGAIVAERARASGIEEVVFDRNGFLYHGRIKALADAARKSGLNF